MLSELERARFADFLERDATNTEQLIEQMKKLSGGPMEALIRVKQAEVAAFRFVARALRRIEDVSI
jgi:ABC-type iron transport system FetAB ATPase subunit